MEVVHNAIAWYQKKIGSYDKQLWEQSVEKKLQKSPPNVHNAPKKSVRHKTEYIDVDLIRGSTFSKTKPQVPWLYITRKAIARVLFFPFYYKWWVLQTSRKLYTLLLVLYCLQVLTIIVYVWDFDDSITEDEVSMTAVILPLILMFLLCLVHSQTVLAHITHKPPKRTKRILELVRKSKPKKATSRKGHRSSGNNSSACPDENLPSNSSKSANGRVNRVPSTIAESPSQISSFSQATPEVKHQDSFDTDDQRFAKSALAREISPSMVSETLDKNPPNFPIDNRNIRHSACASCLRCHSSNGGSSEDIDDRCRTVAGPLPDPNTPNLNPVCRNMTPRPLGTAPSSSTSFLASQSCPGAKNGCCSFDLLDNLPEMKPREKVFRDFCSQTDRNSQTQARGFQLDSHQHLTASGKGVSQPNRIYLTQKGERRCCGCHETEPSLIRETSGESAISGHSDLQSSSEFEVVEDVVGKHEDRSVSLPLSSLSNREAYGLDRQSVPSHRGQSSPDSGVSCQQCLNPSKTTVDNNPHPSNCTYPTASVCEGFCRHCSLDNNSHLTQPQYPTLCMVRTQIGGHAHAHKDIMPLGEECQYDNHLCCYHQPHVMGQPESHSPLQDYRHSPSFYENSKEFVDNPPPPPPLLPSSGEESLAKPTTSNLMLDSSGLQCFSEQLVQGILNVDTLREVSSSSLLANSVPDASSSLSHHCRLSTTSTSPPSSSSSAASLDAAIPMAQQPSPNTADLNCKSSGDSLPMCPDGAGASIVGRRQFPHKLSILGHESQKGKALNVLDESSEQIVSDTERVSDGSNYNPSDSEPDSDTAAMARLRNKCEEKRVKRLRFQEQGASSGSGGISPSKGNCSKLSVSKGSTNISVSQNTNSQRSSLVDIFMRKPLPLKDLMLGRKTTPSSSLQTHSSGSDVCQSEARTTVRRRRRTSGNQADTGDASRSRSVPNSLGLHPHEKKSKAVSSSDNETGGGHTPEGSNKAAISSEEWEDRMQSDESTSTTYSTSGVNTDSEGNKEWDEGDEERIDYPISTLHVINLLQPPFSPVSLQPFGSRNPFQADPLSYFKQDESGASPTSGIITQPDKVSSVIWEGNECKKVNLTALDIGWAIIDKVDSLPESSDYFLIGLLFSSIMGLMPLVFSLYTNNGFGCLIELLTWSGLISKLTALMHWSQVYSWGQSLVMINGILQRFVLSLLFFFLLCVADRTFKQRLLYAKHFSYLTSSRRARKFSMPHFRLNKVRNIKIWLSLRSYLKRRGPQRSVDVIVSASFLCAIIIVSLISLQVLKDSDNYLDFLCNWELTVWFLALAVFLMRFMTLGLKINKKYRNLSVLITEQINLYLQMEQKPHKKEELILANNVLRLAEDLLKELESPFKISGFSANPLIYNITKVIVLSAFSAVLTEVLGFKLKLHKIKLKG